MNWSRCTRCGPGLRPTGRPSNNSSRERSTRMSLNNDALCGRVTDADVKLTYLPSGHPEATLTVLIEESGKDGQQVFKLFIPVAVYGAKAEPLAETLEPGDLVTVRGELGWRAPPATKATPKPAGKLVVIGWEVERLTLSLAPTPAGEHAP